MDKKPQLPVVSKSTTRYVLSHAAILALYTGLVCATFYFLADLIAAQQWMFVATWSVFAAFMLWLCIPAMASVVLGLYLHKHYADRNYIAIDRAYSRTIKILHMMPLRKGIFAAYMLSNLALMRLKQGHFDSAERLFREAITYLEKDKRYQKNAWGAVLYHNLACACIKQKNYVEADLKSDMVLAMLEKYGQKPKYDLLRALPYAAKGSVALHLNELSKAEEYLLMAEKLYADAKTPSVVVPSSHLQASCLCCLALSLLYIRMKNIEKSHRYFDAYMNAVRQDASLITPAALESLNLLANEYMNLKDFARAQQLLDLAYAIGKDFPFHPDAQRTLSFFEKLLLLTDRKEEVGDMRRWLREIPSLPVVQAAV